MKFKQTIAANSCNSFRNVVNRYFFVFSISITLCLQSGTVLSENTSWYREFVDSIGEMLYAAAWPTATYESVSYEGAEQVDGDNYLKIKLNGRSAFDDGSLWTEVIVKMRNGEINDIYWGKNNAILAKPGETISALRQLITELNNEYNKSTYTDSTIEKPNYYVSKNLYFHNDCGVEVSLAITYKNASSTWETTGWWAIPAYEGRYLAESVTKIQLSSSTLYYFAESKESNIAWEGTDYSTNFNGRSLSMRKAEVSINSDGAYEYTINCNDIDPNKGKYLLGFNGKDLEYFNYNGNRYEYGVSVSSVVPGTPAANAGLESDDVIYQIDGENVQGIKYLLSHVNSRTQPWSPVKVSYIRNGQLFSVTVTPKKRH